MDELKWRIARDIASELAARKTDVNELAVASEYLIRTRDASRFFRWLDAWAKAEKLFQYSNQTARYRWEVCNACRRLWELAPAALNPPAGSKPAGGLEEEGQEKLSRDMAETLAWSVRMMRYYETNRRLARRHSPVKVLTVRDLQEGMILDGVVRETRPFGAFVDIGVGRDGLVHISEIAPWRVERVEDELSVGDRVRVKVIELGQDRKRIGLSIKAAVEERMPREMAELAETKDMTVMELAFREAMGGQRKEEGAPARRRKPREDQGAIKKAEHRRLLDELLNRGR